ncbi:hypothetical protein [Lapidilactobacillus bayanensis]|uniref:hypothetical protein n=1 Tax=Lapidilactobacillus bayanensis TaxID=2485998 RepID=UPI000F7B451F|nr:hypothetical protein [Lapidilactobacillus bayanensis]
MRLDDFDYSDVLYALNELRQDFIYEKIPKEKIPSILEMSLEVGQKNGMKYRHTDIKEAIKNANINVLFSDKSGTFFKTRYRAQMELSDKKRQIIIYRPSIKEFLDLVHKQQINVLSENEIIRIHLAHEFFHFIEVDTDQKVNELVGNIKYREGLFSHHSTILKTSEIGAHMFAKTALGLSTFPTYYDFQYLIGKGMMTNQSFDEYLHDLDDELKHIMNIQHVLN